MAEMGANNAFFEQIRKNLEGDITTKEICEIIKCEPHTAKRIIASAIRGVAGAESQPGKRRHHTFNEAFLICLAYHIMFNLDFKESETEEIMRDIYDFLFKEKLLPGFPLRKSEFHEVEDGKILLGFDADGNERWENVSSSEYFAMDIHIMRSVKSLDPKARGRFFYKTYQLVSQKIETRDGVDFHITKSIQGDIPVEKEGNFRCDELTVFVLPITKLLAKFRRDFKSPDFLTLPVKSSGPTF